MFHCLRLMSSKTHAILWSPNVSFGLLFRRAFIRALLFSMYIVHIFARVFGNLPNKLQPSKIMFTIAIPAVWYSNICSGRSLCARINNIFHCLTFFFVHLPCHLVFYFGNENIKYGICHEQHAYTLKRMKQNNKTALRKLFD